MVYMHAACRLADEFTECQQTVFLSATPSLLPRAWLPGVTHVSFTELKNVIPPNYSTADTRCITNNYMFQTIDMDTNIG